MIFAVIQVSGVCAKTVFKKRIPAGIVGAQVQFEFDTSWDGLTKTAVFQGCDTKDVLDISDVVTIPPEVLAHPWHEFKIGIYGVNADATIGIPTLWADVGRIWSAADPTGDTSTDMSLPVWAQLQEKIKALEEQGIAVDMKSVEQAVKDYLSENPSSGGITEIPIATDKILGGIMIGANLKGAEDGTLSVDTTGEVAETDHRPITSQAVYSEFGKIVALLNTI